MWWLLNVSERDFPLKPPVGSHGADHQERGQRQQVDRPVLQRCDQFQAKQEYGQYLDGDARG